MKMQIQGSYLRKMVLVNKIFEGYTLRMVQEKRFYGLFVYFVISA